MLAIGSLVGGKFRIERILGEGGMGLVAVATHLQLDQLVALKVLRDPVLGDPEVVERFLREARASARLRSEHVCKVSDFGQLDDGAPYLVMELLEGSDLAHVVAASPLQIATAAEYVLQACVAVAEAHALGIVHRDLKPANLFLTRRFDGSPLIKVLDFGIAKAGAATDVRITKTSTVMGSPGYMSPEQLRSMRDADARTDVWALGVCLYELVSGHLPFRGDSVTEVAVKVVVDPPEPLGFDAPAFAAVVYRCLEKDLDRRYPSVAALAADLAPLVGESGFRTAQLVASISGMPRSANLSIPPPMAGMATQPTYGALPSHVAPAPSGRLSHEAMAATQSVSAMPALIGSTIPPAMPGMSMRMPGMMPGSMSMPGMMPAPMPGMMPGTPMPGMMPAPSMTTLNAAASQATGALVAPQKRRGLLIGVIAALAAGAVAVGIVLATRGGPAHPTHRPAKLAIAVAIDAGVAPLAVTPAPPADAAALAAAPVDAATEIQPGELRDKLRELAANHDWPAVLEFTDIGRDDPEVAKIVSSAKQAYLAQQTHAIEAQNKLGQCARSRDLAAGAEHRVPDDTTLAKLARACNPRLAQAAPAPGAGSAAPGSAAPGSAAPGSAAAPAADTSAAAPGAGSGSDNDVKQQIADALKAQRASEWDKALTAAEAVLKHNPHNAVAIGVGVAAACHLKREKLARQILEQLSRARHGEEQKLLGLCADQGIYP